jgi:hypothetical protein
MATPTIRDMIRHTKWEVSEDASGVTFSRPTIHTPTLLSGIPQAEALVAKGFAVPCAACSHLRRALHAGRAVCGQPCGGPLSGGEFPEYDGPLTGALARLCFVCGVDAEALIMRPGWKHGLGSCKKHADWLNSRRSAP